MILRSQSSGDFVRYIHDRAPLVIQNDHAGYDGLPQSGRHLPLKSNRSGFRRVSIQKPAAHPTIYINARNVI